MIVFDIDGTLSIVGDRLKYLQQEKKDWDAFYEACGEDKLNTPIADLCKELQFTHNIVFVTGRRESVRETTINWLHKHGLWLYDDSSNHKKILYMRPDGDHRHDTIVKPELVKSFVNDIEMVFEDRNSMVEKWREMGLVCLQVADGDF